MDILDVIYWVLHDYFEDLSKNQNSFVKNLHDIISGIVVAAIIYIFFKIINFFLRLYRVRNNNKKVIGLITNNTWIGLDHWSPEFVSNDKNKGYDPMDFYKEDEESEEDKSILIYREILNLLGLKQENTCNESKYFTIQEFEKEIEKKYGLTAKDKNKSMVIEAITRTRRTNSELSGLRIRIYHLNSKVKNIIDKVAQEAMSKGLLFAKKSAPTKLEELVPFFPIVKEIQFLYFFTREKVIYCSKDIAGKFDYLKRVNVTKRFSLLQADIKKLHKEEGFDGNFKVYAQDLIFNNEKFILGMTFKVTFEGAFDNEIFDNYEKINANLIRRIGMDEITEEFRISINSELTKM